jgi:ribulose 1,5-bisphosphate synthetase/thiazole synthase
MIVRGAGPSKLLAQRRAATRYVISALLKRRHDTQGQQAGGADLSVG